jgi:hypothetical protein
MSSKRFKVSSEGWMDEGERAFARGREYHSSGTQNRNLGFWPKVVKDDWTMSDNIDEDKILEAKEVDIFTSEHRTRRQDSTHLGHLRCLPQ